MGKISQDKNALVKLIKTEMKKLGWERKDLMKASGVSQSTISRYFTGRGISVENVYNILIALNLLKDGSEPVSKKDDIYYEKYMEYKEKWLDAREEVQKLEDEIKDIKKHLRKDGRREMDKFAANEF